MASDVDAGCAESTRVDGTLKTRGNNDKESSRRRDMRGFRPRLHEMMNAQSCV